MRREQRVDHRKVQSSTSCRRHRRRRTDRSITRLRESSDDPPNRRDQSNRAPSLLNRATKASTLSMRERRRAATVPRRCWERVASRRAGDVGPPLRIHGDGSECSIPPALRRSEQRAVTERHAVRRQTQEELVLHLRRRDRMVRPGRSREVARMGFSPDVDVTIGADGHRLADFPLRAADVADPLDAAVGPELRDVGVAIVTAGRSRVQRRVRPNGGSGQIGEFRDTDDIGVARVIHGDAVRRVDAGGAEIG